MSIPEENVLHITNTITIPLSELSFRFARSSGPGGQHVNRSATRVELLFDVAGSPSLTEAQRERALKALSSYIDSDGVLHLSSQTFRSQLRNRRGGGTLSDVDARSDEGSQAAASHPALTRRSGEATGEQAPPQRDKASARPSDSR